MNTYGFLRVAAASPVVRVADVEFNTGEICRMIGEAVDQGVSLLAFPELSLTGYTCGDLFSNNRLLHCYISSRLCHRRKAAGYSLCICKNRF